MSAYAEPPLTIADLEATPDDGNRYELVDGELYGSTSPSYFHQSIQGNLFTAFADYLRSNPIGKVTTGVGVIFDDFNGVIPDLVYFSHERRDRHVKRKLYSSRGVDEYWVVEMEGRTVEIHRKRKEGGLEFVASLQENDELDVSAVGRLPRPRCYIIRELTG